MVRDQKKLKGSLKKLIESLLSLESLTRDAWPSRELATDQAHEVGERPTPFLKSIHTAYGQTVDIVLKLQRLFTFFGHQVYTLIFLEEYDMLAFYKKFFFGDAGREY